MKKITYLLLVLVLTSCLKEELDRIPIYLKIDSIALNEENTTSNISDAWVYINGQLQGVYELPSRFPVLEQGNTKIKVYAGIKNNGIASDRVKYPFYYSDTINEVFSINSTIKINPEVAIKENIDGQFDDLENGYSFNFDTCFQLQYDGPYGKYGSLSLSDSDSILITEINYKEFPLNFNNVPQQGSPTYMELDYRSNTSFLAGMYINFPNSTTVEKELLWINSKEDWNKIYIDLTDAVSEAVGAESFSIFIKMMRDNNFEENKLDFDNIRIIHYKKTLN